MPIPISLFDSYQRKLITLNPDETVTKSTLKTYGCGPTVYNYAHIGNMRAIWLPDTITKVANLAGWQTEWISNITVDDSDDGEDKMEKGAKRENKTVQEIVDLYTEDFKKQCQSLNFDLPIGKYNPKASEYAKEQMILALTLLKENKAYLTGDGIYLDYLEVEKNFENNFSSLSPQLQVILENQKKANLGNNSDYTGRELNLGDKKHPSDFALWKFVDENSLQKWKFEDFEEAGKLVEKFHAPSMHLTEDFGRGERGEKLYLNKHQLTEGFSQNLGSEELHSNLDLTKNFNQTPEDQKLYFITITTKNSRANNETIQKSIPGEDSNKTTEDFNQNQKPVFFSTKERELLLEAFITKSEKENWDLLSVSILSDHLHFIIKSNYIDLAQKISELKGYGSFYLGQKLDKKESSIWNKKLFTRAIDTEEYLSNTLFYIENNFQKHQLQQNIHFQKDIKYIFQQVWSGLKPLVKEEVLPINTNSGLLTKWGCPGWHSECVCMISEISGKKRFSKPKKLDNTNPNGYEIDIHTGGEDHIDIHHKNEIIQSEALGFNLSKTWVHNKFVLVNGKGMSKSVGNVYLVSGKYNETGFYSFQNPPIHEFSKELKEQITKKYLELKLISKSEEMNWESFSFDPLAYRLMLFEHHYNQQLNFTWEKLWQSQMRLWGLRKEAAKIESFIYSDKIDRFEGLLINNLNFAEFIEKYNQFVTDKVNQTQVEKSIFYEEIDLVADFDKHLLRLQLFFSYKDISEIINLGTKRQKAKLEKNYQKADEIRTEIQKLGWQIDDYPWGWGVWWRGC